MAEQRVVLDFFVNGTSRIDQLVNKVSQLEGVVNSLNQVPLEINTRKAVSQFDTLDSELKALESTLKSQKNAFGLATKSINDQQKAIDKSSASIEKYSDDLLNVQRQLTSSNPNTQKYNNLLERQNKIVKKLAEARSDLVAAEEEIWNAQKNRQLVQEKLTRTSEKLPAAKKLQSEAKRFKDLTEALEGLAKQYLELGVAQKKANASTPLASGLDIRAARPRTQENLSTAQLISQANALDLIAKNSSVASSQFNRFTIASEVASQRVYEAGQQRLKALAFGLSKEAQSVKIGTGGPKSIAAARNTIDSLIGSYGGIVKSEAALSSYISRLQSLQSLVPYLSEEYNRLERAIGDVSAEMESLQKKTQLRGAVSKIQPQAGPASLLPKYSIESSAKQYKYQEDLEKKKEALLDKQSGILEKINDSLLSEGRKKAFNLEIDKATELLASNQLEEAQKLTKEIQKQVNERLKLFKGPKTQVFGALGTGFLPVSGGLPSGEMAPGSPKSRIKGPSRELYSTRAFQEQLAFEKAISDQQAKQIAIGQRISQSTARERDKKKLFIQLEQASAALAEGRLEDTIRITREIDKQRFSFERQRKADEARMPAYRTGVFSPASGPRQLKSTLASGAIIEQSLINLQNQGADVTGQLISLQNALNAAKQNDYEISLKNLTALSDQVALAGKYAQLQRKVISGGQRVGAGAIELGGFAEVQERARYGKLINDLRKTYNKTLTSGQVIEQTLINLKGKGADVDKLLIDLQETLNNAKKAGLDTDEDAVLKLVEQITLTRRLAQLEAKKLANKDKEGKTKEPGFGLTAALEKLREARAARVSFLGEGVSPAEAIDKIVREFGTKKDIGAGVGTNVTNALASEITAGTSKAAAAGTALGDAVEDGLEKGLEIKSPSGVALRIARNVVNTLANALNQGKFAIQAASEALFSSLKGEGDQAKTELEQTFGQFRKQFSSLTTKPRYFNRLLSKIPDTGLTVEMAGAATDVFNKIKLPDILEGQIKEAYIKEFGKLPSFFADLVNEIKDLLNKVLPSGVGGGGRPPVPPGGGGGAGGAGDFNRRLAEAVQQGPQALLGLEELRQPARASINELNALSGVLTELRSVLDPTAAGFDRLDDQLRETLANIDRQLERRDPNADPLTRRFGPRTGRAISEGLIGGAFPLLFGQGAGASLGGLLGGAAGGFAGGGLGFGLSLVGTALGTQIDAIAQSATELGAALENPAKNFDALKEKSFFTSKALEKNIEKLVEYGDAASASALVQQDAIKQIGTGGIEDLRRLSEASDKLNRAWAELTRQIQVAIAGPLADLLNWVSALVNKANEGTRRDAATVTTFRGLSKKDQAAFNAEVNKRIQAISGPSPTTGLVAGADANALAQPSQLGPTPDQISKIRAEVAKLFQGRSKTKIEISLEAQAQSKVNSIQKQLESIDIFRNIKDQIKQVGREQEDLQKQSFELARSYEESIGEIRQRIEDEVAARRFANLQKANEIADQQGQNRIKQLQLESSIKASELQSSSDNPAFVEAAKQAAAIVSQFSLEQLSAEEEAAKIKRDAALEAKKIDFESVKFKVGIEKELSRLNIETAKRVADINQQVKRRNEEYDANKFRLEKTLAEIQLKNSEVEANIRLQAASSSLKLAQEAGDQSQIRFFSALKEAAAAQLQTVSTAQQDIAKISAPQKLQPIAGVKIQNVDFSSVLKEVRAGSALLAQQLAESLNGVDLSKAANLQNFKKDFDDIRAQIAGPLNQSIKEIQDSRSDEIRYINLISNGLSEINARKTIEIEKEIELQRVRLQGYIAGLENQKKVKGQSTAIIQAINSQIKQFQSNIDALPGIRDKAIADARAAMQPVPGEKIATAYEVAGQKLDELINKENQAIFAAQTISDAFSGAFREIIAGTATAQEILSGFFQSLANSFADMAAQIIAEMIKMYILKQLLNLFGGGSPFLGDASLGGTDWGAGGSGTDWSQAPGIIDLPGPATRFAMGGVVNSPTLFKFANGGAMNTGVMGEAGPEAILPLSRGSDGKLGVSASGSGGDVNVTVNVDAKGTSVQGNDQSGNQLGRAISAAVQQEIIKQRRPGGLLNK